MLDSHYYTSIKGLCFAGMLCTAASVQAQAAVAQTARPAEPLPWQHCTSKQDNAERLACFDALAASASTEAASTPKSAALATTSRGSSTEHPAQLPTPAELKVTTLAPPAESVTSEGCRDTRFDTTSRMWELTSETDCGNFRFRGYRPISIGLSVGNNINRQPYSPSPENGLANYNHYQRHEARLQLSIRTKLASNLLTQSSSKRDSLWFGYTLNANWQAFNSALSRPFRNTDHQPEFMYVYPLEWKLPGQFNVRYAGLGINHQSNGQSNPLSRSWNRYYLMLGVDVGQNVRLQTRLWQRVKESAAKDDNPNISDYIGRGEFSAAWDVNERNTLSMTLRHSLRNSAKGSTRLEWYHTLGNNFAGGKSNLRLYTSIFSGYGDSLIDYNYRRTVFSVGFSLLDF
ncbi:phospholipase [Lampropedia puyangensis]|uniref:Phospholipase A1 n=1 Tax=Lampropedia puyangensis TaxID=1330072 RepID=A0A4V4GR41_9BURK|nr:phospholipase A [Lampropedia puyangensis]THU00626.1 phospholipase [Lampropedia puyangensis]